MLKIFIDSAMQIGSDHCICQAVLVAGRRNCMMNSQGLPGRRGAPWCRCRQVHPMKADTLVAFQCAAPWLGHQKPARGPVRGQGQSSNWEPTDHRERRGPRRPRGGGEKQGQPTSTIHSWIGSALTCFQGGPLLGNERWSRTQERRSRIQGTA